MPEPTERGRWTLWGAAAGMVVLAATVTGIVMAIRSPAGDIRLLQERGGQRPRSGAGRSTGPTTAGDGTLVGRIVFANKDADGRYHLHVIEADGSVDIELTSGPADERGPAWSPDGTLI